MREVVPEVKVPVPGLRSVMPESPGPLDSGAGASSGEAASGSGSGVAITRTSGVSKNQISLITGL